RAAGGPLARARLGRRNAGGDRARGSDGRQSHLARNPLRTWHRAATGDGPAGPAGDRRRRPGLGATRRNALESVTTTACHGGLTWLSSTRKRSDRHGSDSPTRKTSTPSSTSSTSSRKATSPPTRGRPSVW